MELHRRTWYLHSDEVIALSGLQKSQYGRQYYFNQGFWLRALGEEVHPQQSDCHVRLRLETFVPDERHRIAHLLDLEWEMGDEERIEEIVVLLEERVLPLVERGASVAGLRRMVEDRTLASAAILASARPVLGVSE